VASGEGGAWRLSFLPWEGPGRLQRGRVVTRC
ncbi:hypothetical protein PF010_g26460, partial [Phytophthora fragariae]